MEVFDLRNHLIGDYANFVRSFIAIRDGLIAEYVDARKRRMMEPYGRIRQSGTAFRCTGLPWILGLTGSLH